MAKSKLPSVDDVEMRSETIANQKTVKQDEPAVEHCGYVTREVYTKNLTREQGLKLMKKGQQLLSSGATLKDGRHVTNKSLVVKWLIENHC